MSTKGAESATKGYCWLGRPGSHEQGNGPDLIQVFLKTVQLTLILNCDHTWLGPQAVWHTQEFYMCIFTNAGLPLSANDSHKVGAIPI